MRAHARARGGDREGGVARGVEEREGKIEDQYGALGVCEGRVQTY